MPSICFDFFCSVDQHYFQGFDFLQDDVILVFKVLRASLLCRQLDEVLGGLLMMTTETKALVDVDCFFDLGFDQNQGLILQSRS